MERKLILKTNSKPSEGLVLINIFCYFLGPVLTNYYCNGLEELFTSAGAIPVRCYKRKTERTKLKHFARKNALESQTDDFSSHIQRKYSTIGLISV